MPTATEDPDVLRRIYLEHVAPLLQTGVTAAAVTTGLRSLLGWTRPVVLVHGPPGSGKTRLAELASEFAGLTVSVLPGATLQQQQASMATTVDGLVLLDDLGVGKSAGVAQERLTGLVKAHIDRAERFSVRWDMGTYHDPENLLSQATVLMTAEVQPGEAIAPDVVTISLDHADDRVPTPDEPGRDERRLLVSSLVSWMRVHWILEINKWPAAWVPSEGTPTANRDNLGLGLDLLLRFLEDKGALTEAEVDTAKRELGVALDDLGPQWISRRRSRGREAVGQSFTVRFPTDVLSALDEYAARNKMSRARALRLAAEQLVSSQSQDGDNR